MTDENVRANIRAEVARGASALLSAQILLDADQWADAVSRAYYAAFHHARALVLMTGGQPRSHAGVEVLLQRDVVRAGKLDPEIARVYGKLLHFRHAADYIADYVFTRTSAAEDVAAARRFAEAAVDRLVADGWVEPRGA